MVPSQHFLHVFVPVFDKWILNQNFTLLARITLLKNITLISRHLWWCRCRDGGQRGSRQGTQPYSTCQVIHECILVQFTCGILSYCCYCIIQAFTSSFLFRIVGYGVAGCEPTIMGIGPVPSIQAMLEKTGVSMGEVDQVVLFFDWLTVFNASKCPGGDQWGICSTGTLLPEGLGHPPGEVQHLWRSCRAGPPPCSLWITNLCPPCSQAEEKWREVWHWLCMHWWWARYCHTLRESLRRHMILVFCTPCLLEGSIKKVPPMNHVFLSKINIQ